LSEKGESGNEEDVDPHMGRNGKNADADPRSRKNADNNGSEFLMMLWEASTLSIRISILE
jgi:hypothetical protein